MFFWIYVFFFIFNFGIKSFFNMGIKNSYKMWLVKIKVRGEGKEKRFYLFVFI